MNNPSEEDIDFEKMMATTETIVLKPEIENWLNENIKDVLNTDENTPINERKGWCTGNDRYNSVQKNRIIIFFKRQKDDLSFIEKWSIYKKPVFYFNYFHDDKRDMDIKEIVKIANIDIEDKINLPQNNTNLNISTFDLINWETYFS